MKNLFISAVTVLTGVLCMICSINYNVTPTVASQPSANLSEDISYTIQDVCNLQNFLLAKTPQEDLSEMSYDLDGNGIWNVLDLCLMKRKVLSAFKYDSNILVAYFSRTGTTKVIADYIIEFTGADSFEIEAAVPYTDEDIRYTNSSCRANKEQNDKTVRPEIMGNLENINQYDTIFLGYPIWWGEEPRIIDTFLESYDFSGTTVIPFCTSGSSGISTSEKNIKNLGVEYNELLSGKRFSSGASGEDILTWIDSLPIIKNQEKTNINVEVNGHVLTATLENNSSAKAFAEMISSNPLTIKMDDYANFEKVGALPGSLPRNDRQIDTKAGDIILYQGNQITIYYDENTWNFTRLGRLDNITQNELKEILGTGSASIKFSLKK